MRLSRAQLLESIQARVKLDETSLHISNLLTLVATLKTIALLNCTEGQRKGVENLYKQLTDHFYLLHFTIELNQQLKEYIDELKSNA